MGLMYDNLLMTLMSGTSTPLEYTKPFYIEDISGLTNSVNVFKNDNDAPTLTVEFTTDFVTWNSFTTSTTGETITIQPASKVFFRCSATNWSLDGIMNHGNKFGILGGNCRVGGNIMSLLYGSSFTGNETTFPSSTRYALAGIFSCPNLYGNNMRLKDASKLVLPATILTEDCYTSLFAHTGITSSPVLPATTLAPQCYYNMFNCSSIVNPPVLPATTLARNCYSSMFWLCGSLVSAPELSATTLAYGCYSEMFKGCTSLTQAPELPATELEITCYAEMFLSCTSLTQAPELPATTLTTACYSSMFDGCTNLNYVKCLATDISASDCTFRWLRNVSSTGTFVKDPTMSAWTSGNNGIPTGWTVQNA